jgi:hypothetical protein
MTETEETKKEETWLETDRRERAEANARGQANFERQMALQERLVEIEAARNARPVYGDGPRERFDAYFDLPPERQDHVLREVCFRFVTNAGYLDVDSAIADAEKAFDYIRNGRANG